MPSQAESGRWVSPNDMLAAAREQMLDGRQPESRDDWARVMNFLAHNTDAAAAEPACQLMAKIYDMPLTDGEVSEIVAFQLARK